MGIVINTNVSSLMVQRSLSTATKGIGSSLEKLSTGFRINKAADDAAGLTISEGLRSKTRGSTVAMSNAQNGANLLQTAEGDLGVIQDNLQRVRDLAVQAANGTNGTAERTAIKSEVQARVDEISRISKVSSFNQIQLLDGSNSALTLQIGAGSVASTNSLTIGTSLTSATASALGIDGVTAAFATAATASSYIATIDAAISTVSVQRSGIGALQNRLDAGIQSLAVKIENLSAAESRIRDIDVAKEAANLTKNQILQQASTSLLAQANQAPSIALSLI